MCDKIFKKYPMRKIDPCIVDAVRDINNNGLKTIASCCGHGKYHPSIIIRKKDNSCWDWFTKKKVHNYKPQFNKQHNYYYKRDKDGFYYVPELINI